MCCLRLLFDLVLPGQPCNLQAPRSIALLVCRAGKLLATGSDDKLACLYELKGGPGQTAFGNSDGPNVENWKLSVSLRGHSSHVTDLAWSGEDKFLATCG